MTPQAEYYNDFEILIANSIKHTTTKVFDVGGRSIKCLNYDLFEICSYQCYSGGKIFENYAFSHEVNFSRTMAFASSIRWDDIDNLV